MGNQGTARARYIEHALNEEGPFSTHWVFLLSFNITEEQQKLIVPFFHTPNGWENNLGSTLEDFEGIIERILLGAGPNAKLRLQLVVDLQNYKSILATQIGQQIIRIGNISTIYLFPTHQYSQHERLQINSIRNENTFIIEPGNFDDFLSDHQKMRIQQKIDSKMLSNFNILGFDKTQRASDERRMKLWACINLPKEKYPIYMQKFKKAMQKHKKIFKTQIFSSRYLYKFQEALKDYLNGREKYFCDEMLALYQQQSQFYYVLNLYPKKYADISFEWDEMALPISLMYKAIKIYMKDPNNRKKINKLFNFRGQCILWRGAKFDKVEFGHMEQAMKMKDIYYEQVSFTSTSTQRQTAIKFISQKENYCLFKFILKQPKFEQQIQSLSFSFLSFALLFNQGQNEVLLNALTVCKLISINTTHIYLSERGRKDTKPTQIKEIEMEIVSNLIQPYYHSSKIQDMALTDNPQLPQSIKHYLTTIDIIKTNKSFDIPLALEYSGNFQQAFTRLQHILSQQQNQSKPNIRKIYQLQTRLASLLQKMERSQEALKMIDKAIETCEKIRKACHNISLKQKHSLSFKLIKKLSLILQENDFYQESVSRVESELNQLHSKYQKLERNGKHNEQSLVNNDSSQGYKFRRQAYRFHYAQYLLLLGIIKFKQGKLGLARADLQQSRRLVKEILQEIGYQQLKTETFYVEFLLHIILDDHITWDKNDFFKRRRMEKIASATAIFGGQQSIIDMKNASAEFEQQITKCIHQHEKKVEQRNKILQMQKSLPSLLKVKPPPALLPLVPSLEADESLRLSGQLKGKLKDFFDYFQSIIHQNQNETKKLLQSFEMEFQKLLVEEIPRQTIVDSVMTNRTLLLQFKNRIVNCVLTDYKSTYARQDSRVEIENRLDELILLKCHLSINQVNANIQYAQPQDFNRLCVDTKSYIKETYKKYDNDGIHFPSQLQEKLLKLLSFLHGSMGNHDKQAQVCDLIIGKLDKGQKFKALNLITAYLRKSAIRFEEAEFDFEHALLLRKQFQLEEIRKYQHHLIDNCWKSLKEAKEILRKYNHENQINDSMSQKFIKKRLQIQTWELKLKVFECYLVSESPTASRVLDGLQLKQRFMNLQNQISGRLNKSDRYEFEAEHHEAFSFLFYILQRFDLSLDNLKAALIKLGLSNRHRKIRILTKIFFLFSEVRRQKLKFQSNQLQVLYSKFSVYPIYWRICLAYHFYHRINKPHLFPIQSCIKHMSTIKHYQLHKNWIQFSQHYAYKSYISGSQSLSNSLFGKRQKKPAKSQQGQINPQKQFQENFDISEIIVQENDIFCRQQMGRELIIPPALKHNQLFIKLRKQKTERNKTNFIRNTR